MGYEDVVPKSVYGVSHLLKVVLVPYNGLTYKYDEGTGDLILMYKTMKRDLNWHKLLYHMEGNKRVAEDKPFGRLLDEVDAFMDYVNNNLIVVKKYNKLRGLYE